MNNSQPTWIEKLNPTHQPHLSAAAAEATKAEYVDEDKVSALIAQSNGSIWVRREVLFQAMQDSGFIRTSSCCDPESKKMCSGDQYKGNLEGFVHRLIKLIRITPPLNKRSKIKGCDADNFYRSVVANIPLGKQFHKFMGMEAWIDPDDMLFAHACLKVSDNQFRDMLDAELMFNSAMY